ncbi:MAG: trigger factor [Gammaproteobacteria bacterium]|nr:MAG: trigger factor [Gammaproteobacteria bacterium]
MQVSIETTSGLGRKLTVGVPAERIESTINERLENASKTVKLDGFRKGKVPMQVVKQRFGADIRKEVVGELMGKTFSEAVEQEKLQPAGQPSIESISHEPGQDLEYVAVFDVLPEITLGDFSQLTIEKPVSEVTDEDVTVMLDALRKQSATWEEVDRPAAMGDEVAIDYVGTKDGEEFEGGKAEDFLIELGAGRAIPGFEEGIVGMSVGDEKVLPLTFPEDYHAEELRGANVEFTIKLHSVTEAALPELNDDFFAQYGLRQGGEEKFREIVRQNMERDLKNSLRAKVKSRVMEALFEMHSDVELPDVLVANEVTSMKYQMAQSMGQGANNFDPNMLPDDMFMDQAKRRANTGLLVTEYVKANKLKVDTDRVRERIEEIASTYEDSNEVIQHYLNNQQLLQGVEATILQEQVVDAVLAVANVTEKPVGYQEAIKPDGQE